MSDIASLSVKPDKCHILKSTVDQIQQIKRREQGEGTQFTDDKERLGGGTVTAASSRGPLFAPPLTRTNFYVVYILSKAFKDLFPLRIAAELELREKSAVHRYILALCLRWL